jgi:hypothetical protein
MERNWQLVETLENIGNKTSMGGASRVAIDKVNKKYMVFIPATGFKVFDFNPTIGEITLEGATEEFMDIKTYSEDMTILEVTRIIANIVDTNKTEV